jgi:hypothetical protein
MTPMNPSGFYLKEETRQLLAEMRAAGAGPPLYRYPWDTLVREMKQGAVGPLYLIGYGSLMNAASAARTLRKATIRRRLPVISFHIRRLFNYLLKSASGPYGTVAQGQRYAALNVKRTGDVNDMVNGILLEIGPHEIDALCRREKKYDLVPVLCLSWEDTDAMPFWAHTLCCPDSPGSDGTPDDKRLMPHPAYYRVCREGAAEFGDAFLDFFRVSTYLADDRTLMLEWEADVNGEQ